MQGALNLALEQPNSSSGYLIFLLEDLEQIFLGLGFLIYVIMNSAAPVLPTHGVLVPILSSLHVHQVLGQHCPLIRDQLVFAQR